jgi:MFS family permease
VSRSTTRPEWGSAEGEAAERASAPKRIAFAALLTIVGLNVWTGGPLLALWVGSRVQGEGPPTMGAVFVVVVVLAIVCFVLAVLFSRLTQRYQEMTGQAPTVSQHTPWLRSMRGERPQYAGVEPTLTTPERILVSMVVIAFVLFEVWFFFFSASPIDNRTGRAGLERPGSGSGELVQALRHPRLRAGKI